jgi:hypothetical protein
MALTATQKLAFEELIQQWAMGQRTAGNPTPLVTLAFASTAQVKAATLAILAARKTALQAQQAAFPVVRPQQDAAVAAAITDIDGIVTELG